MNEIIIGKKPLSNYQGYIIMKVNNGAKSLTLRAFGKHISKAMILSDWIKKRFPKFQTRSIEEDRSKSGYIGIRINLEASE